MTTARDRYRQAVAETLTDWRLGVILPRPTGIEMALLHAGLSEIIALRLTLAYLPLLQGLARIEARVGIICDIRADPYAPPPKRAKT